MGAESRRHQRSGAAPPVIMTDPLPGGDIPCAALTYPNG